MRAAPKARNGKSCAVEFCTNGVSNEISGLQALDRGRWPQTSVSLEDAFWNGLKEIAAERHVNLSELVAEIDAQRQHGNLSSALRLFVLDFFRTELSHVKERREGTHEVIGYSAPAFS
jgi:predicted DNA-binding ribbon-helix-helix protein